RPFGRCKEMQVMHRNHLRRVARRQQQGMEGMRHVKLGAGESLNGWPSEPMPREVQDANRYMAVDLGRTPKLGRIRETVLPGTRKNGQRKRAVRSRRLRGGRVGRQQGSNQLMRILADA